MRNQSALFLEGEEGDDARFLSTDRFVSSFDPSLLPLTYETGRPTKTDRQMACIFDL